MLSIMATLEPLTVGDAAPLRAVAAVATPSGSTSDLTSRATSVAHLP